GHLGAGPPPVVLMAERGEELLGLGVFERSLADPLLPIPHVRGYRAAHSFLSGLLVDRAMPEAALDALMGWVAHDGGAGLAFDRLGRCSERAALLDRAAEHHDLVWREHAKHERATLVPAVHDEAALLEYVPGKLRRNLERRRRRLQERGELAFRWAPPDDEAV